MLKFFVLPLIFLITSFEPKAQDATNLPTLLPFDFLDFTNSMKKIKTYKHAKNGELFKMKITNINKNLWGIQDSSKQQNFNSDMSDIFKGIKLPTFLNLAIPSIQGQPSNASPGGSAPSLDDLNMEFEKISKARTVMIGAINLNNEFRNLFNNCNDSYTTIESNLIALVNKFLPTPVNNRTGQIAALRQYLTDQVITSQTALNIIETKVPLYVDAQYSKIKNNTVGVIWEWKNIPPPKTPINRYTDAGKAAQTAELMNENIKENIASIKTKVTQAGTLVDEIQKFLDENKVEELITNYNMINESNFVYYTNEFKIKEDEVSIDILISALKPLPCNFPARNKIAATYSTYGGFKVDFSTGVFMMFGNKDFIGRDLYYKPVDSMTTIIKSKDGGKRLLLGVGGLIHLYWRSKTKVNWAISPGLSTTTSFDGVNFHLGGSLIMGGKNRIVFTIGMAFKESKILDREYQLDSSYAKAELPETPPTLKVFPRFGGFLSLTYNWVKLKTQ